MSKLKMRRLRARVRQRRDQRVDAPLAARRSSAGSASRPSRAAAPAPADSPSAAPAARSRGRSSRSRRLHQIDRPRVAVVLAQDLRHPRRLDLRPLRQQAAAAPARTDRAASPPAPADTAAARRSQPAAPTVRRLIPSRRAISRCETPSAANARTCAHSNALRTSRTPRSTPTDRPSLEAGRTRSATPRVVHFSIARSRCSIGRPASALIYARREPIVRPLMETVPHLPDSLKPPSSRAVEVDRHQACRCSARNLDRDRRSAAVRPLTVSRPRFCARTS